MASCTVSRESSIPPRVRYSLSEWGQTLVPVLEVIRDWSRAHSKRLNNTKPPAQRIRHPLLTADLE